MKFSVVIALYNTAPYIGAAVKSVLDQHVADFEIIVVDDGSTDGGGERVAALADPRILLVRQANAGVSLARNRGIALAHGDWVAFLDADDWLHPDYLQALDDAQHRHPQADVLATQFVEFPDSSDPSWPPVWQVAARPMPVELVPSLVTRWTRETTLCASSFAVRTALLKTMQPCFPPHESNGEDTDLWFRLSDHSPVALVTMPLVAYRVRVKGSLSDINPKLTYPPFLRRMKDRAHAAPHGPQKARDLLLLVDHFEVSFARNALALGKRLEAWQFLIHSARAAQSLRWWSTATMGLLIPGRFVSQWQAWRIRRRSPELRVGVGSG